MNTASYEQVAIFSTMLFNVTEETIDDVYNYFVNTPEFQNEYNLVQLRQMLSELMASRMQHDTTIIELVAKFTEKYVSMSYLIDKFVITLPFKCILRESATDYDEPVLFNSNGFTLEGLHKNDIIEFVDENDEIIMKLTVLDDFENKAVLSVSKYGTIFVSSNINFSIGFNNINKLKTAYYALHTPDNEELYNIILADDADGLRDYMSAYPQLENKYVYSDISPIEIIDEPNFERLCVYISMLYGSVNCFKYLFSSGYYEEPTFVGDIYSIKGGNLEIIRILLQYEKFIAPEDVFDIIIQTHANDLFEFWFNRFEPKNIYSLLATALDNYNYWVLNYIMENFSTSWLTGNNSNKWNLINHLSLIKLYNFEALIKYFPDLVRDYRDYHNEHFLYLLTHRNEYENLTKNGMQIINYIIECNNSITVFKTTIKTFYPNGLQSADIKRVISMCFKYCNYKNFNNIIEYLEELPITDKDIDITRIVKIVICKDFNYDKIKLLDYILSRIPMPADIDYRVILDINMFVKREIFIELCCLFINHGVNIFEYVEEDIFMFAIHSSSSIKHD